MIPNVPEVFIGDGEPVVNFSGSKRTEFKYECELLGIVAKPMRNVPVG